MPQWTELVQTLRLDLFWGLVVAILLGSAIGLERELAGKPAGLRTNVLICVGATLFTQLSIALAAETGDRGRIAAQIVTGVGFIGAGTILHGKGTITGLTSAATIWLVAAIGMAVGAGAVYEAAAATLLVLVVLAALRRVESLVHRRAGTSRCWVEVAPGPHAIDDLVRVVQEAGAEVDDMQSELRGDRLAIEFTLRGTKFTQDKAKLALLRATGAYTVSVDE